MNPEELQKALNIMETRYLKLSKVGGKSAEHKNKYKEAKMALKRIALDFLITGKILEIKPSIFVKDGKKYYWTVLDDKNKTRFY